MKGQPDRECFLRSYHDHPASRALTWFFFSGKRIMKQRNKGLIMASGFQIIKAYYLSFIPTPCPVPHFPPRKCSIKRTPVLLRLMTQQHTKSKVVVSWNASGRRCVFSLTEVGCSLWAALKRNEAANGERMEVSLEDASRLTAALKESTQPLMVMECGHFLGGKWRSWWIVILFLFHSYWCNLDQEVATLKKKVKKET